MSDAPERSSRLAQSLAGRFNITLVEITELDAFNSEDISLVILDIALNKPMLVSRLSKQIATSFADVDKIALPQSNNGSEIVQAKALGATSILLYPCEISDIRTCMTSHLKEPVAPLWSNSTATEKMALESVIAVFEGIASTLICSNNLPQNDILACGDVLSDALSKNGVSSWLKAVGRHHSYTYRHSMIVTGMVVAVGLHFGMPKKFIQFLAVSAILHDVGKINIPLNILDKSGELTHEERLIVEKHPGDGRDILVADGRFGEEIIDMVAHHHEHLDGSGYPDGLAGDQISLMVRLLSIVDVYAALIDSRSYKHALSKKAAFEMMRGMKGKLDMPLLEAFEPILLNDDIRPTHDTFLKHALAM